MIKEYTNETLQLLGQGLCIETDGYSVTVQDIVDNKFAVYNQDQLDDLIQMLQRAQAWMQEQEERERYK